MVDIQQEIRKIQGRNRYRRLFGPHEPEPWPEHYVEWNRPGRRTATALFKRALESAQDERPFQALFTNYRHILPLLFGPHRCWVLPHQPLDGRRLIPDFLYCDFNSLGPKWIIIELESPRARATSKHGSISKHCHHAVEQIQDYRRWLRDNAAHEDRHGLYGIHSDIDAWIIIGRRGLRTEKEEQRLADLRRDRIEIASYDRVFDRYVDQQRWINSNWRRVQVLRRRPL